MANAKVGLGPSMFPLKVHSSGRYFTTQQDVPLFVHGNATWSLAHNLTLAECRTALDSLRSRGFNAVLFSVTDTFAEDGGASLDNLPDKQSEAPFTSNLNPNEAYWAHVDDVMDEIRSREMVVFLSATYLGHSDIEGLRTYFAVQTDAACEDFGEFLGSRYGGYGNVVWVHGGDTNPTSWASKVKAVRTGIDTTDADAIHGTHWGPNEWPDAYPTDFPASWFSVWNSYTYNDGFGDIPEFCHELYSLTPAKPVIQYESAYEGEHSQTGNTIAPYPYRAALSGACGHFFGNNPLWYCGDNNGGWSAALSSTGHVNMGYVPRLFNAGRPWWKLVPHRPGTLLVSGYGDPDANTGVQAGASPDGELAMAFFPSNLTVSVNLSVVNAGARVICTWFNILTGAYTLAGYYATTGNQSFTPPTNSAYVLVIEQG